MTLVRLACSCSERQVRRRRNHHQKILERRFQKLGARIYKRNKRIGGSGKRRAEDIKGSGKLQWSRDKSVRAVSLSLSLSLVFLCPGRKSSRKVRSSGVAYMCSQTLSLRFCVSLISHDTYLLQILIC
jgi:hypothetical protein